MSELAELELPEQKDLAALRRFARKLRPHDVDELVQDTLLAGLESRGRFRGEASFATYLFQIARNVLRSQRRAQARRSTWIENADDTPKDVPCEQEPEAFDLARTAKLSSALESLPHELQHVIRLVYFEELTQEQTARRLSVPAGTVASRLRRAREHLRKTLTDSAL